MLIQIVLILSVIILSFILYRIKIKLKQNRTILRQLESDLSEASTEREVERLLTKQRQLSQRICARCGQGFSLLFNRRLECSDCKLGVCRKCSFWDPAKCAWTCNPCKGEREFRNNSCDWFYFHLQKRFHDLGSAKVIQSVGFNDVKDSKTSQVRDHIEKLVESLVGDNIDNVSIARICQHPSYDRLFVHYHSRLSDCLADLVNAIHRVMQNDPLDEGETPTSAHAALKSLVDRLVQETRTNPYKQELLHHINQSMLESPGLSKQYNENQMYLAESYEDLLATVIINKVVTRWSPSSAVPSEDVGTPGSGGGGDGGFSRQRKRQTSSENQSRCSSASATKTTDSACSSDLDFYKASLLAAEQQKIEANLKTKKLSIISPSSLSDQEMASRSASGSRMSDTDDIISGGSSVGENNWQEQQQYLIEEEIEEVTEYDELDETKSEVVDRTDESSKRKVITTKTSKPKTILSTPDPAIRGDIDCVLAEISHEVKEDEKVPFPEFGVDIVFRKVDEEVSDCSSDESSSSCSASDGGSFDDEPRREKHKTSSHQDLNNIEESGLNSVITCNMRTNEWEDNWLFRRKKTSEIPPASLRDLSALDSTEFVAMLVPNPMDGQEWKAKIGQEDIDQVSEMSERNSEASLDLASMISVSSSDDDEERFNSLEEGQQKDLEHTEYSVLPLRRDSRCFDHLYDSIGSVGQSGDLEFRLSPENASVQAENNVTFTCIVEGTKPIDVAWFHGATLLNDTGGRVALLRRRNVFNLTIFNAHQSDAGVYACMAVNPIGEKCKHFSLEVKESSGPHASPRMPSVEFEFGDPLEACEEFSQVDLNFKVKGHPEPRLIFVKNNCRLQPNENVDIVRNGPFSWTLKLLRCQPRDGGSYTVRAINSIGSTQRKWNVQIKVKERQRNKWITKQTSEKQIEKRKDIYDQLLKANQSKENTGSQSAKTSQAINMPLYPHSILKKPKAVEPAPVVPELPSSVEPIDVDADIFDRPAAQPGTIADREHRKWTEQAIRLQNNPYSRESIERRLLRGTSSDNLSPTRLTRDSDNSGNRDGFKIPNGESSPSSSDDGKEHITISGADRTRRIDCGPKSSNVSRYRRDYYVQSSGGNDYDVIYPDSNKRQFKTSDASSAQGEIVERTKAMLFSRLSVEEDESAKVWRKNESSHKEPSEKQTEEEKVEPEPSQPKTERGRSVSMERRSEEEESSDSERLPDSLDDQGVPDSGVGSSSEKTSTMSKVEAEILRFQREIERASQEKTRQQEWERRKLSRISSSMDSLLSADELPTPSRAPALPPKGKFVSTGNLLPPALPPKQRNLGMTPKRVSISTDEVRIIGIGGYSDESDDDDFYEGEEEEYDSCPSTSSSRQIDPATYCQPPPPPDVVPQQFSRQNSVSQDEKDEAKPAQQVQAPQLVLNKKEKINDIPSKLPSVKELANKFLVKKSPEPMPRKSVKKVDSPLVKEQNPFLFKQSNSSREIHSLTARSVPRQFREGLKKSMPEKSDRNIKFPNATQVADELVQGDALHAFQSDLIVSSRRSSSDSSREDQRPRVSSSNLHIIYDSQKQDDVPYPDADFVRTPSPEHVGIPAGPLRMPPRNGNFSAKNTVWEEYTSDESNASAGPPRSRHPPQNRRKKQQQT